LYPFLKNSINQLGYVLDKDYYDIQGAYGYNGMIGNTTDASIIREFQSEFENYCSEENIVAEFTRFNPVLKNHIYFKQEYTELANYNVVHDLKNENFWLEEFEYSTRKNINKAERNKLEVKFVMGYEMDDFYLDEFINIYYDTMQRAGADKYYFYSRDFFKNITNIAGHQSIFFFTVKGEKVISTELVLLSKKIAYSYLGGTLSEYFEFRPNDLLKYNLILKLKELGLDQYCLGGGISINDGIFRFKKSFARKTTLNFYTGKRIHNNDIYLAIISQWESRYSEKKDKFRNFLLKYRY
jgi:serine/alanine adding enzyme